MALARLQVAGAYEERGGCIKYSLKSWHFVPISFSPAPSPRNYLVLKVRSLLQKLIISLTHYKLDFYN